MLKNILEINGVQELGKNQQLEIQGGRTSSCYVNRGLCCVTAGNYELCEPGRCLPNGGCLWY